MYLSTLTSIFLSVKWVVVWCLHHRTEWHNAPSRPGTESSQASGRQPPSMVRADGSWCTPSSLALGLHSHLPTQSAGEDYIGAAPGQQAQVCCMTFELPSWSLLALAWGWLRKWACTLSLLPPPSLGGHWETGWPQALHQAARAKPPSPVSPGWKQGSWSPWKQRPSKEVKLCPSELATERDAFALAGFYEFE